MRTLNVLQKIVDALRPGTRPQEPLDEAALDLLRQRFRVRHHHFKLLLSSNNEALEQVSLLEELARGVQPFGAHAVRALCARITTLAYRTIKHLEHISPAPQDLLVEQFHQIKGAINEHLQFHRDAPTGSMAPLILPLDQVTKQSVDLVGSKMARLGEARNILGMLAPSGFVITTAAFDAFMEEANLREEIDSRIQSRSNEMGSRMALAQELQNLIIETPLPASLEQAMLDASKRWIPGEHSRLAVRSSALGEDQTGASFAGQHRSAINVSQESLPRVYKEVVASAYSLEAISYRLNKGIPEDSAAMSVGVLPMIDAVSGGVAYSRDPLGARSNSVLVYSVFGLPKQMVDGADAVDFFALDRETGSVLEHDIGNKHSRTICLQDEGVRRVPLDTALSGTSSINEALARRVFDLALALEHHFGEPQDVEWATNTTGDLYLLQARPLPTVRHRALSSLDVSLPFLHAPKVPLPEAPLPPQHAELGRGITVSPGTAYGPVHLMERNADMLSMPPGAVMVLKRPLPSFAPALAEAAAIVAEEGSVAGHLASVARELGKPALFGMVDAMHRLVPGQLVTVDADEMIVVDGQDEARLERTPVRGNLMQGSPVHDMLLALLPLVAKLSLTDPQASSFTATNCQSMHDIFRYCHEQALLAMFEFGSDNPFPERAAQLLFGGKSSQFKLIDLGDTFHERTRGNKVRVEDVHSRPFQTFWRGMTAKPWSGPPAIEARGLMSILHEATLNTNLEPSQPSAYSAQNYFMVAPDFLSAQCRFGFHFCTVEALVGDRPRENYISFQFKGGAASPRRREARAAMISALLEDLGFHSKCTLDWVRARLDNRSAETMENRLAALGFLTMHTRQLDMVMGSPARALSYKEQLLEQLGAFVT